MGIRYVDPSIFKVGAAKVSRVSIDISEMRWLATFSLLVFYELNTKIHGPKRPFLIHKNTEFHERR